jgi:hypothetical protein
MFVPHLYLRYVIYCSVIWCKLVFIAYYNCCLLGLPIVVVVCMLIDLTGAMLAVGWKKGFKIQLYVTFVPCLNLLYMQLKIVPEIWQKQHGTHCYYLQSGRSSLEPPLYLLTGRRSLAPILQLESGRISLALCYTYMSEIWWERLGASFLPGIWQE